MLKKSIIVSSLLCTSLAFGSTEASDLPVVENNVSVEANDLSVEYINKVTSHLDGIKEQKAKIKTAKEEADTARREVRSANGKVAEVSKELAEANENTAAYPRRIKRDGRSIEAKRQESRDIFRNIFPDAVTPDDAIRSVNRRRNVILDDKSILEGRLRRKNNEFGSSISDAQSRVNSLQSELDSKNTQLNTVESNIGTAREEFRTAREELRRARELKNDPNLPNKIQQAQAAFDQANQNRINKGKSCGGLSPVFSKTCRRYIEARENLQRLQNIAKPGSLKPLREKVRKAEARHENLRSRRASLITDSEVLSDDLRRAKSRLADLEEDLRIETRPIRNDIADLDDQLVRLDSRLEKAQRLETIESEIGSLERRIARNEERLAALPALIATLEANLESAQSNLESAQESQADLNEALALEEAVLPTQRKEINDLRTQRNASLSTVTELPEATVPTPNNETELLPSGDWSVISTDLDNEWNRGSCRAETVEVLEETEGEVTSSASLKVVNLVNPTTGFNEPMVVMTVDSSREDLINFNKATMRASSSRTYTFDLIYSKSSKNKLFFMSDLKDRKRLIQFMLEKSRMKVKLSSLNAGSDEEIRFSLKGSTKALNSRSSRDKSMRNACGGIKVTDI